MQESDIKKLRGEIESLSVAVAEKDETQKKIEDFETLKKAEKELNDEKANNLGKANSLRETLSGEQETLRLEEQAIAEARQKIAQELASLQNEKNLLAHTLEGMKKELELPLDENCPTCNQLLPEFTRMTLMEDRERKKDKAQSIEGKIVFLSEHLIPGLEKRIAENDQKQKELESRYEEKTRGMREELSRIDVKNRELHTAVSKIENELDWIDIDTLKGNLKKAESAAITSEELKKQIAVLSEKKNYNEIQAEEYRKELDDSLREKYSIAQIGLEELKEFYQNAQERKVRTESGILLYDTQVKEMEAQLSTVEGTVIECETMKQEHAEWELLERALNGVRDLELDALAPSIADTATKLLAESGDPGSFEIKTTRISGKGAKAKQIEDFLIYYTYDGVSQEIGTCSGGEMVWVRKAIYDAFAIIRAKNARVRFNTVFLDETDGALFPAARMNYYRMLKVAHETLNRYQTILVTQSSEVAAMAEKVIDVRELDTRRTA